MRQTRKLALGTLAALFTITLAACDHRDGGGGDDDDGGGDDYAAEARR